MSSDLVTVGVCSVRVPVSLEKPPRFSDVGVGLWVCECMLGHVPCPRACMSVLWVGTLWDLLGQFLEK